MEMPKRWFEVRVWWVPVWIASDSGLVTVDPLMEAAAGLLRAGMSEPEEMGRLLFLSPALLESALAHLQGLGHVTRTDTGWALTPDARPPTEPVEQEGWVLWDPAVDRPLLQVWIGRRPRKTPAPPPGWELVVEELPTKVQRPPDRVVEEGLGLLAGVPDLMGYEALGAGARRIDARRICRIRRRPMAKLRPGSAWVPVEYRPTGPVIWRPAPAPLPSVETELDPAGEEGLRARLSADAAAALDHLALEVRTRLAPGIVHEAGFKSVEELKQAGHRAITRELLGVSPAEGWQGIEALMIQAWSGQRLAQVVSGDWRAALHGWAAVLEALARGTVRQLRPALDAALFERVREMPRQQRDQQADRQERLLAGSLGFLKREVLKSEQGLRELQGQVDRPTIGSAMLAMAFAASFHPGAAAALADADRRLRDLSTTGQGLFTVMAQANRERIAVIHHEPAEAVNVMAARARVVALARTLVELPPL